MLMLLEKAISSINQVILGKNHQVKLTFACLMANGHLLIEDLPGMGKTTLTKALAKVLGLDFNRIQLTSDILPADIIGITLFDKKTETFKFREGPIFNQVILADEMNRATPKAQGALLEAMEERQVTVEGVTYALPRPFFVLATQNPNSQLGTFPLPEAQLDRFLMRVSLGYPDPAAEREIIVGQDRSELLNELKPVLTLEDIDHFQTIVKTVHVSEPLLDYVQRIIHFTRTNSSFSDGLSPRAAQAIVICAKSWAFLDGREYVIPEDVKAILEPVVGHRLRGSMDYAGHTNKGLVQKIVDEIDVLKVT